MPLRVLPARARQRAYDPPGPRRRGGRPEVVMRASLAVLLAVAAAGARAEPPSAAGPIFGVRAGLGVPYGDVARGGPRIEDLVARKAPLGLELGYRFGRR